jgi:ribulose bisphosphate carboxylase small subunit
MAGGARHASVVTSDNHRHQAVVSDVVHHPVSDTIRHVPVTSTIHHQAVTSDIVHRPVGDMARHVPVSSNIHHEPVVSTVPHLLPDGGISGGINGDPGL